MKVERLGTRARLTIEDYQDLLAVRAMPEWRFVEPRVIETEWAHVLAAGISEGAIAASSFGDPAGYLFDYQAWILGMALDRERFAVFADCGLGKTAIQLEWARLVTAQHGGRTLIVAPLQVVAQTIEEARRFYGDTLPILDATSRTVLDAWLAGPCPAGGQIAITNYEKLDGVETVLPVDAVVLDESSVLKQSMGARRTAMIDAFRGVRWKLCCTATPAPNDRVEYAQHAFFLDVVRSPREFLAKFFVNRDGEWQLKRHGVAAFYRHLAAWSVFMRDPAAYGFADNLASLPPMSMEFPQAVLSDEQTVAAREWESAAQASLFGATPGGVTSRTKMSQISNGFLYDTDAEDGRHHRFPAAKPQGIANLANETHGDEQVLIWVSFDAEADQLGALIPDATVLSGKTPRPRRDAVIDEFRRGAGPRVLVAKASMFGFGLNLQSCRLQIFSTITDSWERTYQAMRRSYRYGQTKPVVVYIPLTPLDEAICQNVLAKRAVWEADATRQEAEYIAVLRPSDTTERKALNVAPQAMLDRTDSETWTMIQADAIAHMPTMDADSMDLAIFSPPFANLFTYSSAAADMGNVRSDDEYRLQWEFFCPELFRVMKPGRVVAVHCMDVIRFAGQHGHRYTYDYPSDLRAGMEAAGFRYFSRIAIDKNPQVQATRTKDQNLLFATLKRDALNSHPQASECVLIFRKPGETETPVVHTEAEISNVEWIAWAHHVWYSIRETDVLNAALAKDEEDERHICPLQLGLIERCVRLWTNPGETVFSPFAGIGSEGWEALAWERRFYGVELKESYYRTACRFLGERETELASVMSLFDSEPAGA